MKYLLCLLLCLGLTATAAAKPWWLRGVESNQDDYLPPDIAFRVTADLDGEVIRIRWVIADGYYLYRHKIQVKAESPDLVVFAPGLPAGIVKTDPFLGTQEIYTRQVEAPVAYTRFDGGAHPLQIKVTYQGCAEAGLCYPPISKVLYPGAAARAVAANATRSSTTVNVTHPWETIAILAGALAFLLAGAVLRKGRRLDTPGL